MTPTCMLEASLLTRDPAGHEGGTLVLADCRVHFSPTRMGNVIAVERPGTPGYEIVTASADHPSVVAWQLGLERPTSTRRMTPCEVAAWGRAVAAVGGDVDTAQDWTATFDEREAGPVTASGATPQ